MKIIITEDDPGIEDVLKMIFEKEGFEVKLIPDGMDIISGDFAMPDIFLIDKQLQGVNGLDVCRYLKGKPSTSHIPVIMISATPAIEVLAKDAGADAAVEKPFKRKDILDVVAKHLK